MRLDELNIPTAVVPMPGGVGSLTVRGISVEDIESIMTTHGAQIKEAFLKYVAEKGQVLPTPSEMVRILREVPQISAAIIALANDRPDQIAKAAKLSIGTQTMALMEIVKMTFESVEQVKKIVENAILGMEGMSELMDGLVGSSTLGTASDGSLDDKFPSAKKRVKPGQDTTP